MFTVTALLLSGIACWAMGLTVVICEDIRKRRVVETMEEHYEI